MKFIEIYRNLLKFIETYCYPRQHRGYQFLFISIYVHLYLFISVNVYSIDSPILHCASVDINGDVTISWQMPADTGSNFNCYIVYSSANQSGQYNDSVIYNYFQTSYLDTVNNANLNSIYYFILHVSDGDTVSSDTLRTIFLNASSVGTVATLIWNRMFPPSNPLSNVWYYIYREYPAGTWVLLETIQDTIYYNTLVVCSANVNYKIEAQNSFNCISTSNQDATLLEDDIVPDVPELDSVSVNSATGNVEIGWNPSDSGDTQGYIIYWNSGSGWVPIDTVDGTYCITDIGNPDLISELFRIASFDSCYNTSPMGVIHNTIHLSVTLDVCDGENILLWNPYNNWALGVKEYQIFVRINYQPWVLLATNTPSQTSYTHTNLFKDSTYCYFIRAVNNSETKSSTSNIVCILADIPQQPFFSYLNKATVTGLNEITVSCYIDTAADVSEYKILRATYPEMNFTEIGTITPPVNPPNPPIITYVDNKDIYTNEYSYYYKVVVVDSCGEDALSSNIGRTILLSAKVNGDLTNTLIWNDYETWLANVLNYNLYRRKETETNWTLLTQVFYNASGEYSYTDDVSVFTEETGKYYYLVEAIEGYGNPYNLQDTSYSNELFVRQKSKFFIPNTFYPGSNITANQTIKPIFVHSDMTEYSFIIFTRLGKIVFETQNPDEGWDGTYKGKPLSFGVYFYLCEFKDNKGREIVKTGTVTLLR